MTIDTRINYDERFDKVDSQFQEMRDQFRVINEQLDKIATTLVKVFDKRLETKADKADMQRIFDLLDKVIKQ